MDLLTQDFSRTASVRNHYTDYWLPIRKCVSKLRLEQIHGKSNNKLWVFYTLYTLINQNLSLCEPRNIYETILLC